MIRKTVVSLCLSLTLSLASAIAQENALATGVASMNYNSAFAAPKAALPAPQGGRTEGPDHAQKWEVEIHGGGMFNSSPDGGSNSALPPDGGSFVMQGGVGNSFHVSSYLYGNGAALIGTVTPLLGFQAHNLDSVLTRGVTDRQAGASYGVRVSRDINPRWAVEFNLEVAKDSLQVNRSAYTQAGLAGLDYSTFWHTLDNGSGDIASNSNTIVKRGSGGQFLYTGGVNFNLRTEGRWIPYASAGIGGQTPFGSTPSVSMRTDTLVLNSGAGVTHTWNDNVLMEVLRYSARRFPIRRSCLRDRQWYRQPGFR
jgi:hypothetical protein